MASTATAPAAASTTTEQYTDSTGTNLQQFIVETLQKKDRNFMLQIEKQLISLVKDSNRTTFKFEPTTNPYYRMLIHRVAAFFGLDHNVERGPDDSTGSNPSVVVVTKTKSTRLPELRFEDVPVTNNNGETNSEPKRLLKREPAFEITQDKERSPERRTGLTDYKSRSFEEREVMYNKARERIFNQQDSLSSNDGGDGNTISSDGRSPSMVSVSGGANQAATADSSLDDLRSNSNLDVRPWSSVESDTSGRNPKLRDIKHFELDPKNSSVHTGSAATSPSGGDMAYLKPSDYPVSSAGSASELSASGADRPKLAAKSSSFGGGDSMDYLKPGDYTSGSPGAEANGKNGRPKLTAKSSSLNSGGGDMDYLKPNHYPSSASSASELSRTDRPKLSAKSSSFGGIGGGHHDNASGSINNNHMHPPAMGHYQPRGPRLAKANSLGGFQHHQHSQQNLRRGGSATIHGNAQSSGQAPLLANPTTFAPVPSHNQKGSSWTSNAYARRSDSNSQNNSRFSTNNVQQQPQQPPTSVWPTVHDPTNQQFYVINPHLSTSLAPNEQLPLAQQQQLYLHQVANYLQSEQSVGAMAGPQQPTIYFQGGIQPIPGQQASFPGVKLPDMPLNASTNLYPQPVPVAAIPPNTVRGQAPATMVTPAMSGPINFLPTTAGPQLNPAQSDVRFVYSPPANVPVMIVGGGPPRAANPGQPSFIPYQQVPVSVPAMQTSHPIPTPVQPLVPTYPPANAVQPGAQQSTSTAPGLLPRPPPPTTNVVTMGMPPGGFRYPFQFM